MGLVGIICAGFNNKNTLPPLPTTMEGLRSGCIIPNTNSPNQGAFFDKEDVEYHPGIWGL